MKASEVFDITVKEACGPISPIEYSFESTRIIRRLVAVLKFLLYDSRNLYGHDEFEIGLVLNGKGGQFIERAYMLYIG